MFITHKMSLSVRWRVRPEKTAEKEIQAAALAAFDEKG